ncbi:hypothetical protein HUE56_28195 (plasmid) [Azospirillum oryzae]|uniref:Uncharacterized protein n=1 Tax=Azospirillum oryzae TaxID=286727 RepID=A0A6N1AVI5_9PROT|nr:hypothetical protein [Azospirillum oryzae]KAA0584858.1 hypothetical protein FZ938_27750 [Azospirillum oryzae]QKS54337.1 hypothetical protein HUE56_28195 [Azospirillum oryzae]GLR78911.1 hypothetical protein GCM10007856_15850 [Azospirillum oryzae]
MSVMQYVMAVPAKLQAGVESGLYHVSSGVVRNQQNQIVGHMEMSGVAQQAIGLANPAVMVGLQAVNTAIMVAGFTMLASKLSAVSQQCEAILEQSAKTDHKVDWLRDAGIAAIQSKMLAGLEGAQSAHKLAQSVLPYDTMINEGALFFRRVMKDALSRGDALHDTDMFITLVLQHAIASIARARSQWLLLGPEEGLDAMDAGIKAHNDMVAALQKPFRDPFTADSPTLSMGPEQRKALKTLIPVLKQIAQSFNQRRVELETYVTFGLMGPPSVEIVRQFERTPGACLLIEEVETVGVSAGGMAGATAG